MLEEIAEDARSQHADEDTDAEPGDERLNEQIQARSGRSIHFEERDREEPRAHVIEALEERLKDLNAAPKSAKNSQTQEVSG